MNVDGKRDILGIWPSLGGEGAKFWLSVLTESRTRGVLDMCIVCCDGLKGLPDAITTTWPEAIDTRQWKPPLNEHPQPTNDNRQRQLHRSPDSPGE